MVAAVKNNELELQIKWDENLCKRWHQLRPFLIYCPFLFDDTSLVLTSEGGGLER